MRYPAVVGGETLLSNALDGLDPVSPEAVGVAVRPRAAATGTNSAKSAPK